MAAEAVDEEEEGEMKLWSWGAGTDGQLASESLDDRHLPQPLYNLARHRVSRLACGGAHAIALTEGGRILTWGRGTCGQLGHENLENCLLPKVVLFFNGISITHISAGWNHSGFVSDNGRLFMCGDGTFGQLGNGDNILQCSPIEILFFDSMHIQQVACGMRHSIVLSKGLQTDSVYGFGAASHGQIGKLASKTQRSSNNPVLIFSSFNLISINANGDHSSALDANGQLYIWGRGFSGCPDQHHPQLLSSSLRFSHAALGWNHGLVIADGEVYMFGGDRHGMLNSPQTSIQIQQSSIQLTSHIPKNEHCSMLALKKVNGLDGKKAICVAAGSEHSALVTEDGDIMSWGWGEHGQLGLGDTADRTRPQVLEVFRRRFLTRECLTVYCGSGFTFVIRRSLREGL